MRCRGYRFVLTFVSSVAIACLGSVRAQMQESGTHSGVDTEHENHVVMQIDALGISDPASVNSSHREVEDMPTIRELLKFQEVQHRETLDAQKQLSTETISLLKRVQETQAAQHEYTLGAQEKLSNDTISLLTIGLEAQGKLSADTISALVRWQGQVAWILSVFGAIVLGGSLFSVHTVRKEIAEAQKSLTLIREGDDDVKHRLKATKKEMEDLKVDTRYMLQEIALSSVRSRLSGGDDDQRLRAARDGSELVARESGSGLSLIPDLLHGAADEQAESEMRRECLSGLKSVVSRLKDDTKAIDILLALSRDEDCVIRVGAVEVLREADGKNPRVRQRLAEISG